MGHGKQDYKSCPTLFNWFRLSHGSRKARSKIMSYAFQQVQVQPWVTESKIKNHVLHFSAGSGSALGHGKQNNKSSPTLFGRFRLSPGSQKAKSQIKSHAFQRVQAQPWVTESNITNHVPRFSTGSGLAMGHEEQYHKLRPIDEIEIHQTRVPSHT